MRQLPASAWRKAVIDTPKRFHQDIRYVEETVSLRDYEGPVRQVAVDGLGNEQPTLLLSIRAPAAQSIDVAENLEDLEVARWGDDRRSRSLWWSAVEHGH